MSGAEGDVDVAAESVRRWVDVATWTAIGLGLAFTAVNVQVFAAAGAPAWSPGWVVAWLLDPMVSVLLLAVVRAEQLTARWQVPMGWQVAAVKWAAFAATYAMNTWGAWRDGIPSSVVLHSVPPVFVLLAAEVAPALRDRLTEAVRAAAAASEPPVPRATFEETGRAVDAPLAGDSPATPVAAADRPAPGTSSDEDSGPGETDPRVREIAELLVAGCDVTGPQAAVLHDVSDRTGRRLLGAARAHLLAHPPDVRPDLHLVETTKAAGPA